MLNKITTKIIALLAQSQIITSFLDAISSKIKTKTSLYILFRSVILGTILAGCFLIPLSFKIFLCLMVITTSWINLSLKLDKKIKELQKC